MLTAFVQAFHDLRLRKRKRREEQQPKPPACLLDLPESLILAISKHLDLADKLLLAETCWTMWSILGGPSNQELYSLPILSRTPTLAKLSTIVQDQYFCTGCYQLHKVNLEILPSLTSFPLVSYCPHMRPGGDPVAHKSTCNIDFHHVQFAMKYNRHHGNFGGRCSNLLQAIGRFIEFGTYIVADHQISNIVELKINSQSLLLKTKRTIINIDRTKPFNVNIIKGFRVCPHHVSGDFNDLQRDVLSIERLSSALEEVRQLRDVLKASFVCSSCPTDFELQVFDPDMISITSYHDLGPGTSPLNEEWKRQLTPWRTRQLPISSDYRRGSVIRQFLDQQRLDSAPETGARRPDEAVH